MHIPGKNRWKNTTDEELLEKFKAGSDAEVLGELFDRYMHLVYGVCLKYLQNRENAQDAVIMIFEKIHREVFNHKIQNFKGWLYSVSKNFCLMEIRKNKNSEKIIELKNEHLNFMETEADLHPIDKAPDENLEAALQKCIERLKAEQKSCIQLFYFENRCYREIAGQLKIEEKKVKSYIQNGKRNLKICLEKQK